MTLWLDAHLSPAIATWLEREHGIKAESIIGMGLHGLKDPEIFQRAKTSGACIVTKDADFVELVLRLGSPPQVVLLSCGNTSNEALRGLLKAALPRVLALLKAGEPVIELR